MKKLLLLAMVLVGASGYMCALTEEEKAEYRSLIEKDPELLTEEENKRLDELDALFAQEIEEALDAEAEEERLQLEIEGQ